MAAERERAVAFLRELARRAARRTEALPFGTAYFDDELPAVWDLNTVWVDEVPRWLTSERLADELDRVQGGAGLPHRQAFVAHERKGAALAAGLRLARWTVHTYVLMAHRRQVDTPQE